MSDVAVLIAVAVEVYMIASGIKLSSSAFVRGIHHDRICVYVYLNERKCRSLVLAVPGALLIE